MSEKKNREKKRERAEVSKFNPVPLFRSYGSTRKEYEPFERLLVFMQRAFVVIFLSLVFFVIGLSAVSWFVYGGLFVKTFIITVAAVISLLILSKPARKRFVLNRKLKKLCEKNRFDLDLERGFWESLKWSPNKIDFTVRAGKKIYYVKLLSVTPYRCKLYLDSENKLSIVKPPMKNRFAVIFDFKTKRRELDLDFSAVRDFESLETVKVLLVNPVCEEIYYKASSVSSVLTGNGGKHFGYNVFSATGFMNYVVRMADAELSKKVIH